MKLNTFAPKKSRAQAMVEFAIVLPLLLLLLYGLLEAGRLLFIYSTIVTATRQASRYGSATGSGGDYTATMRDTGPGNFSSSPVGPNNTSLARYEDCFGIRAAAQRVDFLDAFNDDDITINYDGGPGTGIDDTCDGDGDVDVEPSADNTSRIVVTIDGDYNPIVPRIVPFLARTVAGGNPISATSARTIVVAVAIEVSPLPGSGGPPPPGTYDLQLDMTADKSTYAFEGEVVNFTYNLTNNSDAEISGITFTVTHGSWSCPGTSLAAGASMACTGSYTITAADTVAGSVVAQATATGTDGTNTITSNTGTVTLTFVVTPELNLLKTASTEYATTGGVVTYTFTLTNTGNVPLSPPFTVTDNLMTASCPASGDLAPGAATTCTGIYTLTADDIDDDELVNTASASAMYGTQTIESNESSVTVWTGPLFLRVSASPSSIAAANQTITYTYEIINNTGIPLYAPYTITGHRGTENCSPNPGALPAGVGFTCTGTYTVSQDELNTTSSLDNSVTVTACTDSSNCNGPRRVTSNTRSISVDLVQSPALSMTITSAGPNPATALNTVLNYTYAVTNTGNVTLTPSIIDNRITGLTCPGALAPGASQNCTGTYTVTQADLDAGSITNQATASATFGTQTVSSASQSVTVITYVGPRLKLQITPNPTSFTSAGDFIVYNYTITNTGSVPLNGPYSVAETKVPFVDCLPATSPLPIGASTSCVGSYAVTQADVDAGNVINSANITASDGTQTVTSNSAMAVVYVPGAPTLTPSPTMTAPPTSTPTATATLPTCTAAPVTLTASADAWVDQNSTTTNHGSETLLNVMARNNQARRTLVQFSLPTMPAGCKVQSANLQLFASSAATGRTLQVLRLAGTWTETTVNWSNLPGTTGTAVTTASGSGALQWDVTNLVQAMYSSTNYGFVIRDSSEGGGLSVLQQFHSRENAANQPQLLITFGQAP